MYTQYRRRTIDAKPWKYLLYFKFSFFALNSSLFFAIYQNY